MVIGRLLRRPGSSDPLAGAKAMAGVALLFVVFRLLPKDMTDKWQTPEGMRLVWVGCLSVIAAASLAKAVLDHIFGGSMWQRLRFQPNPKTRAHHAGALIWLHGVGDSGAGFEWLRRELAELGVTQLKVVLPEAPMRALQAAGGSKKRAWFGLRSMPVSLEEPDEMCDDGLAPSVVRVHELIDAQITDGLPASKILVGGFSQGAAVAAWAAAECKHQLGGVVLWSGYAPRAKALQRALSGGKSARGVPFVAYHGDADDKVKLECGVQLSATLEAAGVFLHTRKIFEGLKHGCTREQLEQLAALAREVVSSKHGEGGEGAGKAAAKPKAAAAKKLD